MSTTAKKDQAQSSLQQAGQNIKEGASTAMDKAKEGASSAVDKAKEGAANAYDKVKEGASTAVDKAREAASHTGEALSSAASAVGRKAEDATSAVGRGMESLAGTVRDRGPDDGMLGRATRTVADALDSSGRYLEEKNLSGMADDMTKLIKNNPIPALLVGVGLGFLLGRALRS